MIIDQTIKNRRSTFPAQFKKDATIPASTVDALLDNARWAPTHRLTQPWRFKVFTPEQVATFFDLLEKTYREETPEDQISTMKIKKFHKKAAKTSHVIVIVNERDEQERVPEIEEICATAAAAQNIYLSLEEHGIGGYWSTGSAFSIVFHKLLGLNDRQKCLGYFLLGIPDHDIPQAPRERLPVHEFLI